MLKDDNLVTDYPSLMQREMGIAVDLANDGRSRSAARLKYSLNDGGSWRQQRIPGKSKNHSLVHQLAERKLSNKVSLTRRLADSSGRCSCALLEEENK